MKHGFKVLSRANRKLRSCSGVPGSIRYMIGKAVHPKPGNGPLAVFKDRKDAQVFADLHAGGSDYSIRPCTYKPSRTHKLWCPKEHWPSRRKYKLGLFPPGTDFASEVIIQKGDTR